MEQSGKIFVIFFYLNKIYLLFSKKSFTILFNLSVEKLNKILTHSNVFSIYFCKKSFFLLLLYFLIYTFEF